MTAIVAAINRFVNGFIELLKSWWYWATDLIYELAKSVWFFIVDALCSMVEAFFNLIDFKNSLFTSSLSWSSMPDQIIYILNECGFDNALLIITSALLIRLLLNLIPSWATRV